MKPRRLSRFIAASTFVTSGLLALAPVAHATDVVDTDPCPAGYYGVQVIVQTPNGSRTVYACLQP